MSLTRIYAAPVITLAHLMVSVLKQHGISAWVRNENLVSLTGILPFDQCQAEVWVQTAQLDEALEVLKNFGPAERGQISLAETESPEGALSFAEGGALALTERACPTCQEANPSHFEVCWACQAELS